MGAGVMGLVRRENRYLEQYPAGLNPGSLLEKSDCLISELSAFSAVNRMAFPCK
jgi:hypothetical protein